MKLKREHLALLGCLVALGVVGYLSWAFLLNPLKARVTSARSNLAVERAKLEDAKAKAAQYEKFQAEAENVRRGLQFLNSRLDASLTYEEEMELFDGLSKGRGLRNYTVKLGKPAASKEGTGLSEVPVTVKFDGSYHDLGEFLNQALSQRRLLVPQNFHLVSKDATGRTPSLTSSIDLVVLLASK
jgi:Tfp pilus assembly protein PilO